MSVLHQIGIEIIKIIQGEKTIMIKGDKDINSIKSKVLPPQ